MKEYLLYVASILAGQFCEKAEGQLSKVDLKKYDFIDSTKYRPKDKILVGIYSEHEHEVAIDLIQRSDNKIEVIQMVGPLESQFGDTEPFFGDFNQDGLLDLKLKYGSGGRGANTLFHLLIQVPSGKLKYVKGSAEIPNLKFDTGRQVIMGTYYSDGTSFVDFKLVKDSLIAGSGVDVRIDSIWTCREFYKVDENGKRTIIKRDSVADKGEGLYTRE